MQTRARAAHRLAIVLILIANIFSGFLRASETPSSSVWNGRYVQSDVTRSQFYMGGEPQRRSGRLISPRNGSLAIQIMVSADTPPGGMKHDKVVIL
jgi:hypothetical protein